MGMDKEDKKKVVLTDEKLKEVTGGGGLLSYTLGCGGARTAEDCVKLGSCMWADGKCVLVLKRFN